jgi:hypothetical protein
MQPEEELQKILDQNPTDIAAAPVNNPSEEKSFLSAKFFTEEELARELDRTTRTLRRWHSQRTGPPRTMIGSRIYYRRESVFRWLVEDREEKPVVRRPLRRRGGAR